MKTEDIKIAPKWQESKDEIWNEVFANLDDEAKPGARIRRMPVWRYVAAAVVVIAIAGTSFAYLYTTTETAVRGLHLAMTLPDGSNVNLNAESQLTYKPYWWFATRDVTLKGEAYFEVKPGSRFTVVSNQNRVRVLGTSFNVLARDSEYSVTCLTGKVEVAAVNENTVLTHNMRATLRDGRLEISESADAAQSISWTQNKFSFVGVPLTEVIREIERQYNIRITTSSNLDYLYTGNFSKTKDPTEVLEIIGKPFGISFKIE